MEPNADNFERIQIFGVFSIATDQQVFQPAQRGYLYFKLSADNKDVIRREWADLKAAADTHTVIAFGGSGFAGTFSTIPRLRKPDEKPSSPDPYVLGAGLSKMRSNTDYGPIKSLLEYRQRFPVHRSRGGSENLVLAAWPTLFDIAIGVMVELQHDRP